jgi:tetratricopeptide (TPR) repeat protein
MACHASATRVPVIALLFLLTFASTARSDDLARKTRAVALIKQALPMQDAGRHEEAIRLLDESWATFAHPKALFYKGRSLVALKRWDAAQVLYEQIRASKQDLEADKLAEVEANLTRCRDEIDKREAARAKPVTVLVVPPRQPTSAAPMESIEETTAQQPDPGAGQAPPLPDVARDSGAAPSTRRTWAWVTLGTGVASTLGGLAFLGNFAYQQSTTLAPDEHREGGGLDLALGGTLTALGVGLGVWSIFLFRQPSVQTGPTAFAAPTPGGGMMSVSWTW